MKQKEKKNRVPALLKTGILLLMTAMLFVPCADAQAASAKSKALKAYKNMLSQDQIDWSDDGYMIPLTGSEFALAYVDNNNVPEMVVYNPNAAHASGYGRLYTYKNGKVSIAHIMRGVESFDFYKKTGIFSFGDTNFGNHDQYYYKLSGTSDTYIGCKSKLASEGYSKIHYYIQKNSGLTEVSKNKFNKKLTKLAGSKKETSADFYKNTKKNRNKYL